MAKLKIDLKVKDELRGWGCCNPSYTNAQTLQGMKRAALKAVCECRSNMIEHRKRHLGADQNAFVRPMVFEVSVYPEDKPLHRAAAGPRLRAFLLATLETPSESLDFSAFQFSRNVRDFEGDKDYRGKLEDATLAVESFIAAEVASTC